MAGGCPLQAGEDGGMPGAFLTLPAGARGAAIGAPYSSWPGDYSSIFWNPAQLSNTVKPELGFSRTALFEDTSNTSVSFAWPHKKERAAGIGYIRQASGGFERRNSPFDAPSSFDITNDAFFASFSALLPPARYGLRGGLSVKAVRYAVGDVSAWGTGADAGLLAELPRGLRAGAVIRNLVRPSLKLVSDGITFPSALDLSISGERRLGEIFSATLGAGLVKYERQTAKLSLGAEVLYGRSAALRLGVSGTGFSTGMGLRAGNYSLDYAVLMHEVAPVHTLSLAVKFGISSDELEEYITRGIGRYNREDAAKLAAAYAQQAELMRKDGNLVQAIKTLETANLWDPSNAEIENKITAYRAEMDAALTRQAVERNLAMADRYLAKEDLLAAREYLASVLDLDPANAGVPARIAEIDKRLGEREQRSLADAKLREAAERSAALLKKASNHLRREEYTAAIAAAQKAAALNPEDAAAANSLMRIARQGLDISLRTRLKEIDRLCETGDYAKAMKIRASVLRDDPANKEAEQKGRVCVPADTHKPGADEQKKIEKLYYMAVDAYLKNKLPAASAQVKEILTLDPGNEAARKLEGKILWAEGGGGK
ncbi:MAG: hypothetical protein A2X35_00435 [Elusimicrobia bacterium GWA2_61_42]|nr:MAG: hypothetical protein A2X35_00435 [Elusimicrobia bacterium GWA2_61_42]OGR79194.1 MAG: hypothetical protein A2X38_06550 [Elusimicrobia bacterium GWC2_61_25]